MICSALMRVIVSLARLYVTYTIYLFYRAKVRTANWRIETLHATYRVRHLHTC